MCVGVFVSRDSKRVYYVTVFLRHICQHNPKHAALRMMPCIGVLDACVYGMNPIEHIVVEGVSTPKLPQFLTTVKTPSARARALFATTGMRESMSDSAGNRAYREC